MPKMIVSIDGVVIKEVTLAKDRTTLGRRPYNDIVIDNLAISGEHAVLHMIGGDVYLEDLNSTNGTYVNGRAVKKQALEHNDVVEVGKYKIRFLVGGGAAEGAGYGPTVMATSSEPIPLSSAPTVHTPLGGSTGVAVIRVLSGSGAGRELSLQKVVTTIGKPGVAVAAVTRRLHGYVVAPIDGGTALNGEPLGNEAVALQDGDVLELGGTRMQFVAN
ncbi:MULTISPECIES: FHA domain-containing protein [unclassified Variovorax]|uniref:FHA domain-containing protein n=1 Tax=unclassified Variovorax TaxID=663243 RepID=UPI00076CD637|nr:MULTISPECIES: FHA domain-containing protein [unclassified Variovorax]KWT85747.1 FHA domain containing protein [Variovorax sp. WDL1]PNG58375.1 Glycogen accumulation regulator GarA [Variovorax sp. B4]PNG61835.1 Glycogen accumulation regulator GarA [Variovorax sp. B2]VTV12101.1 Glycogen accumulation regulator GarA [Variovorax sp. WDL1]